MAPEAHEMLKTSFGNITMGRTWIFSGFLDSNVEKTAEDRERGGRSSIVSGDEKLQTVRKIVKRRTTKAPFRKSPAGLTSRMEHVRGF
jgi:DNA topoisomerase IA